MAPQPSSSPPKAATILGVRLCSFYCKAEANRGCCWAGNRNICWCIQIIPQIYKNWRRHSTEGVPGWMVLLWASAMPIFGAYCLIQNLNRAIQVQPQLFCFLCLICWGQTLYYAHKYKPWQAALIVLATMTSFATVELLLVFTLRIPYRKGIELPMTVLGIVSAIMINLGLVAPYIDAAKRDWRIIGISFRFLSIDFSGALFSLLSLCFQDTLDRFAASTYVVVMAMEIGICIIQCSWICRKWSTLREARKMEQSYDEFTGAVEKKSHKIVRRDEGPRLCRTNWSVSTILAAMNHRHGEVKSMGDVEDGNHGTPIGDNKSDHVVAIEDPDPSIPQLPRPTYQPSHRMGPEDDPES